MTYVKISVKSAIFVSYLNLKLFNTNYFEFLPLRLYHGRPMKHENLITKCQTILERPLIDLLLNHLSTAEIYLVGGSVRDLALNKEASDLDLACNLTPQQISEQLNSSEIRIIPTGIDHGTLTLLYEQESLEITTFRKPGSRTTNSFSKSIEEDLAGRDFTINAIAFDLRTSQIIDPYSGLVDLSQNYLRAVGTARTRFEEDPLRMLRAIRFGPAEGRTLDQDIINVISEISDLINTVSIERIQVEFSKIIVSDFPDVALTFLVNLNLANHFLPEIIPTINFEQNEFHTEDVYQHTLTVIKNSSPDLLVRLAAFFHDLGKPETLTTDEQGRRHFYKHEQVSESIAKHRLSELKYSKEIVKSVARLVSLHMRPLDCGPAGVRRIIRDTENLFDQWLQLKIADSPPTMPAAEFQKLLADFKALVEVERNRPVGSPYSNLAISGDDLISLGLKPGKKIGEILKWLHEEIIEQPELNTREQLIDKAKSKL